MAIDLLFLYCRPPTPRSRAVSPSPDTPQDAEAKKSVSGAPDTKPRIRRFVPDIQEIRVRWVCCSKISFCCCGVFLGFTRVTSIFAAPLCQRKGTYISWSHTPTDGWSATLSCGGRTSTSTTQRETLWSGLSSTSPLPRWSTVRTSRQCWRLAIHQTLPKIPLHALLLVKNLRNDVIRFFIHSFNRPRTHSPCVQNIVEYCFKPLMTKRCMIGCMRLILSLLELSGKNIF